MLFHACILFCSSSMDIILQQICECILFHWFILQILFYVLSPSLCTHYLWTFRKIPKLFDFLYQAFFEFHKNLIRKYAYPVWPDWVFFFIHITRVSLRLKKGQGAENKKRALLIFLRAHFWFPKALLSLKVYDIFNV